jgi:hypothetical protein
MKALTLYASVGEPGTAELSFENGKIIYEGIKYLMRF